MAVPRASGPGKAAAQREDSRERLAEADSNWVSAEPWEEQPGARRPALRPPALMEKSGAVAPHAVSIQPAPGEPLALVSREEQPADALRV